jgi:hypothetical protein
VETTKETAVIYAGFLVLYGYCKEVIMLIDDLLYALGQIQNEGDAPLYVGLTAALRFQVDNVAHYVHVDSPDGKRRPFQIKDSIPNIAPLAPIMWFEYGGQSVGKKPMQHFGCFLTIDYDREGGRASKWDNVEPPENIRWVLRAEYFSKLSNGDMTTSDWIYFITVGDDGQFLGVSEMKNTRYGPATPDDYVPDVQECKVWHEEIIVSLMAICFAHCKGTEIEERQPSRQVRRAAERKGKPVFTFHTIDIQPATRVLHTEGHINENGLARALHICRGHFAHYTADKPLFGKYTGTFYRPMHVRGKAEQGVSIKDYRVHPSETS